MTHLLTAKSGTKSNIAQSSMAMVYPNAPSHAGFLSQESEFSEQSIKSDELLNYLNE